MDATNLVAWLPFDTSATEDKLGNEWTANGSPTIENGELKLDGSSYIQHNGTITLGGKDFTISGWVTMSSSTTSWGTLFEATTSKGGNNRIEITRYGTANTLRIYANEIWGFYQDVNIPADTRFHLELDYQHSASKLRIFVDGVLAATVNKSLAAKNFIALTHGWGTKCTNYFTGSIDEFLLFDGVALHTENFTPPTAADYAALAFQLDSHVSFTVDVQRKLISAVEVTFDVQRKVKQKWRYVNLGTADTLLTTGTTLTNLPETQSKTGTAFYQEYDEKCFDIPATDEIWVKFDVYFNGSTRFFACNRGSLGNSGIASWSSRELDFLANESFVRESDFPLKPNTLQTILLHMVSDSSAGVIETWVDEQFIYRYTGDVNHGQDFAVFYLYSGGAGTFFSNVIISNAELTFGDGYHSISFDIERKISTASVDFTFDVERNLIEPIIIPAIGEHFNHVIDMGIDVYRGGAQKIILPKKSKAYIHAVDYFYPIRVFSDTDPVGKTAGTSYIEFSNLYVELDECEEFFIRNGADNHAATSY